MGFLFSLRFYSRTPPFWRPPKLHPSTITAVKERADIVDVVSEHVVLKRQGREFVGLCPFHEDNSPSMTVSPAKQDLPLLLLWGWRPQHQVPHGAAAEQFY